MKNIFIKKINLSLIGHGTKNSHSTQKNYLKSIFKNKYQIISSLKSKKDCINFVFEGWHDQKKVENFLSKKSYKYGIIFTESYNKVKYLDPKFTTINNFLFSKFDNTFLKKIYFYFLFFQAQFLYFNEIIVNKINLIQSSRKKRTNYFLIFLDKLYYYLLSYIKKPFLLILVLTIYKKNISSKTFNNFFTIYPMFKIIFLKTFKNINMFHYYINLGFTNNLNYLINKNDYFYYNLPYLMTKSKKIPSKKINFLKFKKEKKFDLVFFGRVTEYRKQIFEKINKLTNLKIFICEKFVSEKKIKILVNKSKFIVNLPQYQAQDFVSSGKVFEGIDLKFPVPNLVFWDQKYPVYPSYLKNIIFKISTHEIEKLNKFFDNYDEIYKKFLVNLIKFEKYSKEIKNKFINDFVAYR